MLFVFVVRNLREQTVAKAVHTFFKLFVGFTGVTLVNNII